jgi:hypothetical protein
MKVSNSLIASAVVVLLPLAAIAGDKDKTPAPMGTANSAHFDKLDVNRDGRLTQVEAATDSKIVFTTADKNGDGYLDANEYMHRDMMDPTQSNSSAVDRDAPKPRE